MFRLSLESPDDQDEVEWLFDLAFAPGRQALSSYQLREGVSPVAELCMVARDDLNVLAGAIRYWPIMVGDTAALLLGPVAVHPTYQGEGLGALLVGETLTRGRGAGWKHVVLIGDEPYYSRFGFSRAAARGISFPPPTNPDRVLARALTADELTGLVGLARRP
ncbi:MAG: GNAT family N-acetyltransferase [Pikeienuella sp.]